MTNIRTSELLCPESLTLIRFTQFYLIQETTDAEFRHVIQRPHPHLIYFLSATRFHAGSFKAVRKVGAFLLQFSRSL